MTLVKRKPSERYKTVAKNAMARLGDTDLIIDAINDIQDGTSSFDHITEKTSGHGVDVDGVLLKDGIVKSVNGTIAAPAIVGAATNSGIYFASGVAGFSTAGSHSALLDGQGDWNIGNAGSLELGFDDKSGAPGSCSISKATGRAAIASGQTDCTITSSRCTTASVVLVQLEGDWDATLTRVSVIPGNGSFIVRGNAASTGNVKFSFLIVNLT